MGRTTTVALVATVLLVLVFGAKLRGLPLQERFKADFGSNRSFMEGF